MAAKILHRFIRVPFLLFGVILLIFITLQLLSPEERVVFFTHEMPRNPWGVQALIQRYCLDCPLYQQYWNWLVGTLDPITHEIHGGILRGNLGYARIASQPVTDMIAVHFPATLEILLCSLVLIIFGICLGVIAPLHHNKFLDQLIRLLSIIGGSLPAFLFGLLMLMFFYARLGWFPPERLSSEFTDIVLSPTFHGYTRFITVDSILNGRLDIFWDAVRHLILPVITLTYIQGALLIRITRTTILESLRHDYIITARSKRLASRTMTRHHILPKVSVATMGSSIIIALLNGAVITEAIFNYPGIGEVTARAAMHRDVETMLGMGLFFGFILVIGNLLVDIFHATIDPRVRLM